MSFGSNLEQLRKQHKISQMTLGKALGLTQQMISTYEQDLSSPNVEVLIRVADHFKLSIDELVGHTPLKDNDSMSSKDRLTRYYDLLTDYNKDRCLTIIETILETEA